MVRQARHVNPISIRGEGGADYSTKMSIENKTANGSSLQFMQIEVTTNILAVHSAHSVAPPQLH